MQVIIIPFVQIGRGSKNSCRMDAGNDNTLCPNWPRGEKQLPDYNFQKTAPELHVTQPVMGYITESSSIIDHTTSNRKAAAAYSRVSI